MSDPSLEMSSWPSSTPMDCAADHRSPNPTGRWGGGKGAPIHSFTKQISIHKFVLIIIIILGIDYQSKRIA
jgi:hypothetical protein